MRLTNSKLYFKKSSFYIIFMVIFVLYYFPKESQANDRDTAAIETTSIAIDSIRFLDKPLQKLALSGHKEHIAIASWNIQHLGRTKTDSEIAFMASVLKDFDIVAIQEVVAKDPAGAQKVAQLADELNRKGAKWDYAISDPTSSPSVYISERYAFLWKTSKLSIQGRPYLDSEFEDLINREPYVSKFKIKASNEVFYVLNFHSRPHNDKPELEIQYFKEYQNRMDSKNLILAGDFNLNERHPVWDDLYHQGFKSALNNSKTTLKHKCSAGGYLSHDIDNIYYSSSVSRLNSAVVDYVLHCDHLSEARKISDHLPIFLEFSIPIK